MSDANLQERLQVVLVGHSVANRVGELYSLVRFLGGDPFSFYFCMFPIFCTQ